jgi:hypothetical protein
MFFKSEILQTTHITTAENYLRKAAQVRKFPQLLRPRILKGHSAIFPSFFWVKNLSE